MPTLLPVTPAFRFPIAFDVPNITPALQHGTPQY
jgi:hypothetical protein